MGKRPNELMKTVVDNTNTFREDEREPDHDGEEEELERPPLDAVDPRVAVDGGRLAQPLHGAPFVIVRLLPWLHLC